MKLSGLASTLAKSGKTQSTDVKGALNSKTDATQKLETEIRMNADASKIGNLKREEAGNVVAQGHFDGAGLKKKDLDDMKKAQESIKDKTIETPSQARSAAGEFINNNKGKVAIAAGMGSAILFFYARKKISEMTPRTITKVEMSGSNYKISFTPAIAILKSDSITISGSPVAPDINGPQSVSDSTTDDSIIITGKGALTTMCPPSSGCGTITVKSSVYGQMADAIENVIPDLLPDSNVFMEYWWVFLILVVLFCSSSVAAVMMSS
jgi:hypothetical protein